MGMLWQKGQAGQGVAEVGVDAKRTEPPDPYTEGTLLRDMKGAARFIADPRLREALKEADGIGTAATRPAIIERIKEAGFVSAQKKGKTVYLRSTEKLKQVLAHVPAELQSPGTTALWEQMLAMVSRGDMTLENFVDRQAKEATKLVETAKAKGPKSIVTGESIPCSEVAGCKGGGTLRLRPGPRGSFWACSNYPQCTCRFDDVKGKPVKRQEKPPVEALPGDGDQCPQCGSGTLKTRSVTNPKSKAYGKRFLGCSEHPKCDFSQWEDKK